MSLIKSRLFEKALAAASFITAVALAFTALLLSPHNDIAAGVIMVIAQFLLLTASILGLDYKLNQYGTTTSPRSSQPQPA